MHFSRHWLTPLALAGAALLAAEPVCAQASGTILVSTDWLAQHLKDPGLVIIHVAGGKSDYDAGHVPGAQWLPFQSYTGPKDGLANELPEPAQIDSVLESVGVSDNSRIIITGGPITSLTRMYFTLDYFGLGARTSILDGGIEAWREEGRAVERTQPTAARGSLTLRPQFDKYADAKWVLANTTPGAHVAVIDARAPEFFAGLSSNNNPRPGRLPMAQSVPYTWITGELTRFRDKARLERLFAQAGVRKGDKVISYCHVGMQATVVYVAAKLLGYDAAVYDGSFEDWSKRSELPVTGPAAAKPPDR